MIDAHDKAHLLMAEAAATQSKDPRTKVGAVLVSPDRRHVVYGYNGFPPGIEDQAAVYARQRQLRIYTGVTFVGVRVFRGTNLYKDDLVVHAELNAILNCGCRPEGYTLYCTHRPCIDCAKHIAAAGIARVVCQCAEPTTEMGCNKAEALLRIARITYERIQP